MKFEKDMTYDVEMGDCCVAGSFTSKVIDVEYEDEYLSYVKFENGVELTRDQAVTAISIGV